MTDPTDSPAVQACADTALILDAARDLVLAIHAARADPVQVERCVADLLDVLDRAAETLALE